jgi:hypothetical protein
MQEFFNHHTKLLETLVKEQTERVRAEMENSIREKDAEIARLREENKRLRTEFDRASMEIDVMRRWSRDRAEFPALVVDGIRKRLCTIKAEAQLVLDSMVAYTPAAGPSRPIAFRSTPAPVPVSFEPKKRTRIYGSSCTHDLCCGHLYDDKYLNDHPYMVLHKRSRSAEAINLMDCTLITVCTKKTDFDTFCDRLNVSLAEKQVVVEHFATPLRVPLKKVDGFCVVCENSCAPNGMSGLCNCHVICGKCFGIYLKLSGEKMIGPAWGAKPRYIRCPGSLMNKICT